MLSLKDASKLLSSPKERREKGLFIIEGKKPVKEALNIDGAVSCLFMTEAFAGSDDGAFLYKTCKEADIDVSVVSENSLKKVSGLVTPEGVMAAVSIAAIEGSFRERFEGALDKGFPLLFIEDLQDPGNLGTIIRSAEAAGISKIVLSKESVDPFSPKVVRATMGSIFRVPVKISESEEGFYELISKEKEEGYRFYAAALSGKRDYTDIIFGKKAAILIGNEARGLSGRALSMADEKMLIPMEGLVESLNAAVATAIILFEAKRQRGNQKLYEWKQ